MKTYDVMVITPSCNQKYKISADTLKTTCDGIYEFMLDGRTIAFFPVQYTVIVLVWYNPNSNPWKLCQLQEGHLPWSSVAHLKIP